jgi:hypothetical protein
MSLPSYVTQSGVTVKLTGTSSMPCASWSLPAGPSCPAAKASVVEYGANAICKMCYATRGFYRMGNVQNAQDLRFQWVRQSLATGANEFVEGLIRMITDDVRDRGEPIFRVHDSGDVFSVAYADAWYRICEALPDVQFWIPTRSHNVPTLLLALQRLNSLPNVTVRPSALELDAPAPVVLGLAAGTTVVRSLPVLDAMPGTSVCPKTDARDGRSNCDDCRTCWEGSSPVAYVQH